MVGAWREQDRGGLGHGASSLEERGWTLDSSGDWKLWRRGAGGTAAQVPSRMSLWMCCKDETTLWTVVV